jgi:hypothetical protein
VPKFSLVPNVIADIEVVYCRHRWQLSAIENKVRFFNKMLVSSIKNCCIVKDYNRHNKHQQRTEGGAKEAHFQTSGSDPFKRARENKTQT